VRWNEHVKWFESKLNDPRCVIYVVIKGRVPIGQVRYDLQGSDAVVSASLVQGFRGMGYGSRVLRLASQKLLKAREVKLIHAYVKRGNRASVAAFAKAGYNRKGTTTFHGHVAAHLVLDRDHSFGKQNHDQ
jgi:RimJ/RimL family protein N-acetyltransferase